MSITDSCVYKIQKIKRRKLYKGFPYYDRFELYDKVMELLGAIMNRDLSIGNKLFACRRIISNACYINNRDFHYLTTTRQVYLYALCCNPCMNQLYEHMFELMISLPLMYRVSVLFTWYHTAQLANVRNEREFRSLSCLQDLNEDTFLDHFDAMMNCIIPGNFENRSQNE